MCTKVIYHASCYDGFTAAWIAKRAMPEAVLIPARHGEDAPRVDGDDVYVVDFSYPRDKMSQMWSSANSMVVLDHHKTAQADCEGLSFCHFDMNRSGAGMAWDYFNPGIARPAWVDRIEDRDLWRFKFGDTHAVHAFIASQQMSLKRWDEIHSMPFDSIVEGGSVVAEYIKTFCAKASQEARVIEFAGHRVVVLNTLYLNASETASVLLERHADADFSMTYYQDRDGRWGHSLRSRSEFDVSVIAKKYGGGGHAQAAGFGTDNLLNELA